jgi:hypothetical protein
MKKRKTVKRKAVKRKTKVSKKKLRKIAAGLNALSGELFKLSQGSSPSFTGSQGVYLSSNFI